MHNSNHTYYSRRSRFYQISLHISPDAPTNSMTNQKINLKNEIEKRQKQGQTKPKEPKLRKFEPEGRKPDLAHLSGPLSQKRIFPNIEKRQKQAHTKLLEPKTPKTRTQRGETGPGASFCTILSKTVFFRRSKNAKNGAETGPRSPNSENSNPKGGNRTWRICLDLYLQNGFSETR